MKNKNPLMWIWKNIKKYIWFIILLSVVSAASTLCYVYFALISRSVIDVATGAMQGDMFYESMKFFLIIGVTVFLNILYSNLNVRISGHLQMKIRQNIFDGLLKKKWSKISEYHSGDILNRLTSDVDIIVQGITNILPQSLSFATKLIVCVFYLFSIDPVFTTIFAGLGILIVVANRLLSSKMKALHKACQSTDGLSRSFMQECVENLMVIKSFCSGQTMIGRLKVLQINNFKFKVKRNTISNLANSSASVIFSSSYYVALIWGANKLSTHSITFGTLTMFLSLISQIQIPIKGMPSLFPQYYSMVASSERIIEIEQIESESEYITPYDIKDTYAHMNLLCLQDITFSYSEDEVLKNMNLTMKKGEFLAIAGESGIGKSTIIKLLLGLFAPSNGRMYISLDTGEEIDINSNTRGLFAFVPQGNMVLSGTIRENITFCNTMFDEESIINASKVAEIWDYITELELGLDTIVGERGLGLSEGQIQRIAIARALLSDAPILLLDEATSALDERTEEKVLNNLKELKSKTCIIVSHKRAAINICDKAVKIDDGKIADL